MKTLKQTVRWAMDRSRNGRKIDDSDLVLATLLSNLPGMAYRCRNDAAWTMEFVSDGCLALTGYTSDDLIGSNTISYGDLIHPEDREDVWRRVQEGVESRSSFQLVYRIITKGGDERWAWEQGTPIFQEGVLGAIEGFISDITERKEAERRLRESEEKYRLLAEHTTDLVCIHEPDGRYVYVSPSSEQLLGYTPEELTGRNPYDLFHPDDKARIWDLSHSRLLDGTPVAHITYRLQHRNGTYVWLDSRSMSVFDDKGRVTQIVSSTRDVTERKAYEHELIEAREQALEMSRLKSNFLANMSHEIRTPLTSILGFASLLAEEIPEEQRQLVESIQTGGERLMATLNSVLDLSMLESGNLTLRPERVDVGELVRQQADLMSVQAASKRLQLHVSVPEAAVEGYLDRQCVDRIVMNLLSNSIKFTETGGVFIVVARKDRCIYIMVEDTGIGISEDFLPHLFNEFRQESSGMARRFEGVGLGLAITRKLVDMLEGNITVESEPGKGTSFTVALPDNLRRVSASDQMLPDDEKQVTVCTGKRRILALDDNEQMLQLVERFLKEYDVKVCLTADEALAFARRCSSDAVLLDVNLGGRRSGVEVMQELRRLDAYKTTPILAVTAYALPGDRDRFMLEGFDAYIPKPFGRDDLLRAIQQHVAV